LENFDAEVEIGSICETIRGNSKILGKDSLCFFELGEIESWFDEWCSKVLDQWKQAKFQWLKRTVRTTTSETYVEE
jgi:hypothetical protein